MVLGKLKQHRHVDDFAIEAHKVSLRNYQQSAWTVSLWEYLFVFCKHLAMFLRTTLYISKHKSCWKEATLYTRRNESVSNFHTNILLNTVAETGWKHVDQTLVPKQYSTVVNVLGCPIVQRLFRCWIMVEKQFNINV